MPHPDMYVDDDPILARVREIALALPGAAEKISHGRPVWYTTKVFAWYAMSLKEGKEWIQHPQSVAVLLPEPERSAVRDLDDAFVPGYIGASGWTGLDLDDDTDWAEMAELIEESYRQTSSKSLVAELDAQR